MRIILACLIFTSSICYADWQQDASNLKVLETISQKYLQSARATYDKAKHASKIGDELFQEIFMLSRISQMLRDELIDLNSRYYPQTTPLESIELEIFLHSKTILEENVISIDNYFLKHYPIRRYFDPEKKLRKTKKIILMKRNFENLFSKGFGYTLGSFQWKTGKLKAVKNLSLHLNQTLKPLDILFERTRNRVSAHIIPGFFVHNAIYIGSYQELESLGIFKHKQFLNFEPQKQQNILTSLKEGKTIVEALRMGVTMNTIDHFLNIDDLAIARHKNLEQPIEKILFLLDAVGSKYDFTFDLARENRHTCSELVFETYKDVAFKPAQIFGRGIISPDMIARKTFAKNTPFNIIEMYIDGKKIENRPLIEVMKSVVKSKEEADVIKPGPISIEAFDEVGLNKYLDELSAPMKSEYQYETAEKLPEPNIFISEDIKAWIKTH